MNWLVLTYSFPAQQGSSARVTLWRRLSRLGAVSPKGGVHILPAREDCLESFQWLLKEVQQQNGECLLMSVDSFEGLTDQELIQLFRDRSEKEYGELEDAVQAIEKKAKKVTEDERDKFHGDIERVRQKHADIARTDFFDAPGGVRIRSRLANVERLLWKDHQPTPNIEKVNVQDFQGKVWATRPRPHVDRIACAWLIRRFIDSSAKIKYVAKPSKEEISFDMKEGGTFGHVGNFCTFETMCVAFQLQDPALRTIGEIVHEIDLHDSRYLHPETAGIESILKGWLLTELSDAERESHGLALFDGLYADINRKEKPNS